MHLGRWNRLTVFRHDWGVWLQLNGGKHQEGRSQVLLTKVTRMLGLVELELKRGLVAPDWGVWLQLNGGKHQEGQSQVLLTKVTRMLG